MKTTFLKTICYSFILTLMTFGCKKDNIQIPMLAELPVIYQGCSLKEGNSTIVKNQTEFDTVFDANLVSSIDVLQNIDFYKYDLLVGAESFTRGIIKLEHSFAKKSSSEFIYSVTVYYNLTLPAGTFFYGILVDKLPDNAKVNFVVSKLNE
jgi:hypothetical protein